jgi:hypothetical protein
MKQLAMWKGKKKRTPTKERPQITNQKLKKHEKEELLIHNTGVIAGYSFRRWTYLHHI